MAHIIMRLSNTVFNLQ